FRRGRLGKPDAGRLGARLGVLVRRHGGVAVHVFSAGGGLRMRAGRRRTHLWPRAAGDVCAGRRPRLRSQLQRPRRRRQGHLWRRLPAGRAGIFPAQFRICRHHDAVRAVQDGRGRLQKVSRRWVARGRQPERTSDGAAGLRPVHQGEPRLQPAGCARRDLGDGAAELHHARARTGKSLRRSLGSHRSGQGGLMPDLLLELFSEEIPARMQAKAADDLRRMVTDKLVAEGLVYEGAKAFATPRRLALTVHGIPARQSDLKQERRGPKVGAPEAAVQGFLKAAGLKSLDEAKVQRDPKGDFYIALIEKPGRATLEVLADMLPAIVRTFPWPKSMRWGERSARPGALNWVRPLHSIVATFGLETEEPDVVRFAVDGIETGQTTCGHRFMAPAAISVRRFEDYEAKLAAAKVLLDPNRRKDIILADAKQLAFAQGFELVEDPVLLDEVAGLVEWPVALMGSFAREL